MKTENEHSRKHIKLDSLDKKQVFSVPENYFEELPSIIQIRAIKQKKSYSPIVSWSIAFRYALPVFALVMMLVYFGTRISNDDIDVQAMLDEVPTEELVAYISESDMTTEELLSLIDIDELDLDGMVDEDINLLEDNEWDDLIDTYPELENEI